MERLRLNDRVVGIDGNIGTVAGIDTDYILRCYIIAWDENTHKTSLNTLKESPSFKMFAKIATLREDLLSKTYSWEQRDALKTFEEEKAEIIAKANPPVYVRRFESGAVRSDDRGREKPSYVSPYAIKFVAEHFSKNAAFFNDADSAKNYFKGIKPVDIEDSLERHMLDFKFAMMPQERNRDKIKQSLVEIMANCVMALHQIGLEEDGKYKEVYDKMEYVKKEGK